MTKQDVLNLEMGDCDAFKKGTIKDYLHKLLEMVWTEGECFNGKRPFGNSGWESEIYHVLIKNKVIHGTLNSEGYVEEYDENTAHKYVLGLIDECFKT